MGLTSTVVITKGSNSSGTSSPSSITPSRCNSMDSLELEIASSRVLPWEKQPGHSGTTTEYPVVSVFRRNRTVYRMGSSYRSFRNSSTEVSAIYGQISFFAVSLATSTSILLKPCAASLPALPTSFLNLAAATGVCGVSRTISSRLFFRMSRSSSVRLSTSADSSNAALSFASIQG